MEQLFTNNLIKKQLDDSRRDLLDLSTRNRLISIPLGNKSARLVQIFDEKSEEVYRRLITDKKNFTFLPGKEQTVADSSQTDEHLLEDEDQERLVDLPLPNEEIDRVSGKAKRHVDSKLQTRLSPETLQRRLFDLHNEARTITEEQGVNVLYLALGFLRWQDRPGGHPDRFAPLLLIPIDLIRQSISDRFAIKWREEEVQANLSLAEKLSIEYGILLPPPNIDEVDGFDLDAYFKKIEEAVASKPNWSVEPNSICIGFFSFAKFLMYKDLDSESWPGTSSPLFHSLVRRLLVPGADKLQQGNLTEWTEGERLDERITVERLDHVVDADNSQTIAIEMVREGRNLVIQGPPGTGKSQTITNIIATAVLDNKKVLFLAEKLAALEVVKHRLEREGLGALCLELHSNKARKNTVVSELKTTWNLGSPAIGTEAQLNEKLTNQRTLLNDHVTSLHTPASRQPSPFQLIGSLSYHGLPQGEELSITFPNAEHWTSQEIDSHRAFFTDLITRLNSVSDLAKHPWRGARTTQYTGLERQSINQILNTLLGLLNDITQLVKDLLNTWKRDGSSMTIADAERLQLVTELAGKRPANTPDTIHKSIWDRSPESLVSLAQTKLVFEQINSTLQDQIQETIWQRDWREIHQQLERYGRVWYNFLIGSYRQAIKQMTSGLKTSLPASFEQRRALVSQVMDGQRAYKTVNSGSVFGQEAFGSLWEEKGRGQDLVAGAKWINELVAAGITPEERQNALAADTNKMRRDAEKLKVLLADYQDKWRVLQSMITLSVQPYTGVPDESAVRLTDWSNLLVAWRDNLDFLSDWAAWQQILEQGRRTPTASLISLIEKGQLASSQILPSFERIVAYQQLNDLFRQDSRLVEFNGDIHNQRVADFRRIDHQRLDLAKVNVLTKHYQLIPQKLPIGATGTVLGEINRQRFHKPIRKLLSLAGSVVQDLKPVFMMSPLSVAQFLEPGKIEFDLLVIDEASQVKPVDALGAIARCRQIVVVGDDKQLPPSNFFSKLTTNSLPQDDDEEEDSGLVKAKEMESILSLAKARGLPDTLLRWHYRSKHHSLIAVSNRRYYENKLYIVPSPWKQNAGLGLIWRPVQGIYDRSNSRANAKEAEEVAKAVIHHAIHHSEQTLGVAAFSMAQQRAIQDEVERLRRQSPQSEAFFSQHLHEPFFVKNLENVQGDERDVIFLSVGYGRDANGKLSMNFGPLNRQGGERRLNVLISRAKKRCEVFASITDQDIELDSKTGEGVVGLKQFLQYARTGKLDLAERSDRQAGSDFEKAVKEALEVRFGWEVHTQVGEAGFFIDLAVVDPDRKGRYIIGIECDGWAYHSSPSARERDRLRQSILESQGWIIHRLWGIDFFRRKDQELAKIKAAYDEAFALLAASDQITVVSPEEEMNGFYLQRQQEEKLSFSVPYEVVTKLRVPDKDPYVLSAGQISELVQNVLSVESPMHFDELTTRMREQWEWNRAGDKFRKLIEQGVAVLRRSNLVSQEDAYITLTDKPIQVRSRSDNAPAGTRKPVHIPPSEIDIALEYIIRQARSVTREEVAKEVSVLFGFRALSTDFRTIITSRVDHLVGKQAIRDEDGNLFL